jgi:hypothetical protein
MEKQKLVTEIIIIIKELFKNKYKVRFLRKYINCSMALFVSEKAAL